MFPKQSGVANLPRAGKFVPSPEFLDRQVQETSFSVCGSALWQFRCRPWDIQSRNTSSRVQGGKFTTEVGRGRVNSELTARQFNSLNSAAVNRKRLGSRNSFPPRQHPAKVFRWPWKRRKECAQRELFPQSPLSLKISSRFISLLGNNHDVSQGFQRQTNTII